MPHAEDCRCPICRYSRGEGRARSAQLSVRLDPDVKKQILSHPKGTRAYLEALVREESALHGKLSAEKLLRQQEHHAREVLEGKLQRVQAQNQIYLQALRQLAESLKGAQAKLASQALADGEAALG